MASYNTSTAGANFEAIEAIEAAEIALGRTWAKQALVRQNVVGNGYELWIADDPIEREFWGGDWRPANRFEAVGIAEALAEIAEADKIEAMILAHEADYADYCDTIASARFGFALI